MRKHPTLWSSVAWVCLVLLVSLCARAHHASQAKQAGAHEQAMDVPRHQVRTRPPARRGGRSRGPLR